MIEEKKYFIDGKWVYIKNLTIEKLQQNCHKFIKI